MHVNRLFGVWAGPPACELADPRADQRTCVRVSGLAFVLAALLGATKRARRSSKRSTAPTNTAILTIGIRGAHKPHDNRLPNQESPPNREPRGTARGAADVSGFRPLDAANDGGIRLAAQRTTRPQQTRSHATTRGAINGGTHRQVPRRQQLTSPTQRPTTPEREPPGTSARRRRLTSHATNTPRCIAAELMRLTWPIAHQRATPPGSSATAVPRKLCAHTKPSIHPPTGHAGHSRPHNETTTFNTNYPAPTSRKIATKPTRFIRPTRFVL